VSATLLMPKATAVWLVENTSLTFDQIAEFCTLHPLEVKGIADGEVANGIKGQNPVMNGQLTREMLDSVQKNPQLRLKLAESKFRVPEAKRRKGPRYTPLSRRQDRPNAILWLIKNHPELKDAQIMRLVGTTKHTIDQIKTRTHWNSTTLQPVDPVALSLCTQIDLDFEVNKSSKGRPVGETEPTQTLLPTEITTAPKPVGPVFAPSTPKAKQVDVDAASVFAKLKALKSSDAVPSDD
jgi:uncharacterized protein